MSQSNSVALTEPKAKRSRVPLHQPLPIPLASLTGQPASKDLWQWYHGKLVVSNIEGRSSSAHVLIESGQEAHTVYNNGYFGILDCKEERETFNRRNEDVKLVQKDWLPGGDFEVMEERNEDEVDWLEEDDEINVSLGTENEVDPTVEDGICNDEELNSPPNIESEPTKCWDDLKKLNPEEEEDNLKLELCEAFFLSFALGCLLVSRNGEEMTLSKMWSSFRQLEPDFMFRYSVYHHFRAKGWVVRSGHKFGVDWLLYKHGPSHYHASYSVRVEVENNPNILPSTWLSLAGLTRVCQTTGKELLLARVKVPPLSEADMSSPNCLKKFSVTEVRVRPWVPSCERWDEKPKVPVVSKQQSGFKMNKGHQGLELGGQASKKRKQSTEKKGN